MGFLLFGGLVDVCGGLVGWLTIFSIFGVRSGVVCGNGGRIGVGVVGIGWMGVFICE